MSVAVLAIILGSAGLVTARPGASSAVELSGGTRLPANPPLPKLHLTNPQREQIRKAVLTEHNEVQFRLATTKSARDFTPSVGAKLPKGVKAQSLPEPVLSQIPELRDYYYVKMKDEVLIVDGMTGTIVDMFSETQPVT
jgi:hypothetical protein